MHEVLWRLNAVNYSRAIGHGFDTEHTPDLFEMIAGIRPGFDSHQGQGFFSLCYSVHTCPLAHRASYPVGISGSFLRGKAAGA
jgi:hypothetical protein